MYEVQSGQYLKRVSGLFTYPVYEQLLGFSFTMTNTKTVVISSGSGGSRGAQKIQSQVQPKKWLLADTGGATSEVRRIEKYDNNSGTITLNEPFTLAPGVIYSAKILPEIERKEMSVSFFSDSQYQLSVNGVYIPRRAKIAYSINSDYTPFVLYSAGEYIISEGKVTDVGTSDEIFGGGTGFARIYYYNGSDAAIQGSTAKKKIFPILAGKTINDFAIFFIGSLFVQRLDDSPTNNEVVSTDGAGEVTFKNNQPSKGIYLIIVNI